MSIKRGYKLSPTNRNRGMLGPDKDEGVFQVPSNFLGGMQPQRQYNDNKLMQMGADREVQDEFLAQTKLNRSDGTSWDDFKLQYIDKTRPMIPKSSCRGQIQAL